MKNKKNISIMMLTIILLFLSSCTTIADDIPFSDDDSNLQTPIITHVPETPAPTYTPTPTPEIIEYASGLFSWVPNTIEKDNRDELYEIIDILEIDEVYQYIETLDIDNEDVYALVSELNDKDIDFYMLSGASNWTYTPDGEPMIAEIDRAVAFREQWDEDLITGIVFDIEPYDSHKWIQGHKEELLANYVTGMKAAYERAKEENLRVIICIPTWFEKEYFDTFMGLLDYCDEISVMNYGRSREYENIIDEIDYARQYEIDVTCIFEFQDVGLHNLTDEQTYSNVGIDAAINNFETIYRNADYPNLKFAYHYLLPLKDMLLNE